MSQDPAPQSDFPELERLRDEICSSIERLQRELARIELLLRRRTRTGGPGAAPSGPGESDPPREPGSGTTA